MCREWESLTSSHAEGRIWRSNCQPCWVTRNVRSWWDLAGKKADKKCHMYLMYLFTVQYLDYLIHVKKVRFSLQMPRLWRQTRFFGSWRLGHWSKRFLSNFASSSWGRLPLPVKFWQSHSMWSCHALWHLPKAWNMTGWWFQDLGRWFPVTNIILRGLAPPTTWGLRTESCGHLAPVSLGMQLCTSLVRL